MSNQHRKPRKPVSRGLALLPIVFMLLLLEPADAHATVDSGERIFIPLLMTESACEPTTEEANLLGLLSSSPAQARERIDCEAVLSAVARHRAQDMAVRDYFGHVDPNGVGPNQLVRAYGYRLTDEYSVAPEANNVESIAGGFPSAQEAWNALLDSPTHRRHLLGEDDFYREQTDVGIGYFFQGNSDYQHYWVIITARPAGD